MTEQFDKLCTSLRETARDILLETGEHRPQMWLSTDIGGITALLVDLPHDFGARHAFAASAATRIKRTTRATKLLGMVFISEAWMTAVTEEEWDNDTFARPSDNPKRRECLIIAAREVGGENQLWIGEIIRLGGENGKPIEVAPLPTPTGSSFDSLMLDAIEAGWNR